MAPESAMRGHYSIKSDVFSFGVLILEIVTGRRNGGWYSTDESADLLSLVSASLRKTLRPSYNIEAIWISNAGMGALDDGNGYGDHGYILEHSCSTRPDGEVHPHRAPLRSR